MSVHEWLMKAHTAMRRRVMEGAQREGLTSGQPKILEYLMQNEGSDQRNIALSCEIEPATVGSILTRMEAGGLVERRRAEGNRRSLFVYLTERGKEAAMRTEEIFAAAERAALEGCSEEERERLCLLLARIYRNLARTEAEE